MTVPGQFDCNEGARGVLCDRHNSSLCLHPPFCQIAKKGVGGRTNPHPYRVICPAPVAPGRRRFCHRDRMPFSHLPPLLAEALTARGYEALTPVQSEVSKPDSSGRDLLVS